MSDFNTPLATTPLTLKLMSLTMALGVGLSCQSEDFDQDTQGRPFIDFISIPGGRVTIGPWRMDITRDVTIKSFQLKERGDHWPISLMCTGGSVHSALRGGRL